MSDYEKTGLWTRTLAPQPSSDDAAAARERLRSAFSLFRERAALLAAEIARSLPDFTVHDIAHLDALWEMADLIAGPDYPITPTEAFVLGGAFLIHDLGMGLAAYPGGEDEIRRQPEFADQVALALKHHLRRIPTAQEIQNPPADIATDAIAETLRALHARQASQLALLAWRDLSGAEQRLIEDPDIRSLFGSPIGLIGYSHWWSVAKVAREFSVTLGSPYWCPNDWTVDPLKVACLLRAADASHIDARRAPAFLGALRKPRRSAAAHWQFQEKIHKPQLIGGRLTYTSGATFPMTEASAWWICQETIEMIDRELRDIDALLADTSRRRFAASAVAGAGDPIRLVRLIPTAGWIPVDTRLRVGNIPALVKRLGGEQLYGHDATIPLRELLQNATDAVRARRVLEGRASDWGEVVVRLSQDGDCFWLEVHDTGIGMSSDAMTCALLDFGASYWDSRLARQEHPGLYAKGFSATGRFGIGFFSVFMLGENIQVISRRPDDGRADTRVLEFASGVDVRPILRQATADEQMNEPGTAVRVMLKEPPKQGLLAKIHEPWTLLSLCAWLAPANDVTIWAEELDAPRALAVQSGDWETLQADALLRRIFDYTYSGSLPKSPLTFATILRELRTLTGGLVGRAFILPEHRRLGAEVAGVPQGDLGLITVGGLRSSTLLGIAGVLVGDALKASRDAAVPLVELDALHQWASEQARLIPAVFPDKSRQLACAQVICALGADTADLPVAYGRAGYLSVAQVRELATELDVVRLIDSEYGPPSDHRHGEYEMADGVLAVTEGRPGLIWDGHRDWPELPLAAPDKEWYFYHKTTLGRVVETLLEAWGEDRVNILGRLKIERDAAVGRAGEHEIRRVVYALYRRSPRLHSTSPKSRAGSSERRSLGQRRRSRAK